MSLRGTNLPIDPRLPRSAELWSRQPRIRRSSVNCQIANLGSEYMAPADELGFQKLRPRLHGFSSLSPALQRRYRAHRRMCEEDDVDMWDLINGSPGPPTQPKKHLNRPCH